MAFERVHVVSRPWIALLFTVSLSTAASADFEAGRAAYERGDYSAALSVFRSLAEHGHAAAQCYLGHMHHKGEGVPLDRALAAE